MRFRRMLFACSLAAALGACAERGAPTRSEGAFVLEVGGDQGSLREALRAAGVQLAGGGSERQQPRAPAAGRDDEVPRIPDAPVEPPPPPEEDPFFVVPLADGQTLIHLARKHLGDGNRFRELLELNGWSEADSRRLRVGQQVKIPRSPAATPPARR